MKEIRKESRKGMGEREWDEGEDSKQETKVNNEESMRRWREGKKK